MEPFVRAVRITDALSLGAFWHSQSRYKSLHVARVQAQKHLNGLVDLKKLERIKGAYRLPGVKSEWTPHAKATTYAILEILTRYPSSLIYREKLLKRVGLRPDVLALVVSEGWGICLWVEVPISERTEYFEMKQNAHPHALEEIRQLFQQPLPGIHFVRDDQLTDFLEEISNGQ